MGGIKTQRAQNFWFEECILQRQESHLKTFWTLLNFLFKKISTNFPKPAHLPKHFFPLHNWVIFCSNVPFIKWMALKGGLANKANFTKSHREKWEPPCKNVCLKRNTHAHLSSFEASSESEPLLSKGCLSKGCKWPKCARKPWC